VFQILAQSSSCRLQQYFKTKNEPLIWDVEIVEQERPTAVKATAVAALTVATG
jgi:hypothetical protein